jgi:hypothetical protein
VGSSLPHPNVTITTHPNGFEHTRSTIAKMAKLARDGAHSYAVRNVATRIVHDVPSKQVPGELQALYRWVRDNIRYRFDPVGLEWVQAPLRTIAERSGDCDDMAVLLAALAGSLGHDYRFLTVGPTPSVMKHVAVEVWDGKRWVTLDPVLEPPGRSTAPRNDLGMFGRRAPHRARHLWSSEGTMLAGPVDAEGVALWESQLGSATVVHVEPPSVARSMVPAMRRMGLQRRGGRPPRVGPRVAAKLHARACKCRASKRGLSGPVSVEQTELWSWNAYYPSDPNRVALPAPIANDVYRSKGSPGFNRLLVSAPSGTLSGGLGYIDGLGFGFLKKIGKAIGGAVKGVTKVVTKIPGVNIAAGLIPGGSLVLGAAKKIGNVLSPDKKPAAPGAPAPVEASAPQALTADGAPSAASPYAPAPAAAPVRIPTNIAQRNDIDALRNEIRANAGFATKSDLKRVEDALNAKASAKQQAAQKKAVAAAVANCKKSAVKAQKKAIASTQKKDAKRFGKLAKKQARKYAKLVAKLNALRSKPCPELGAKYPAGSKQRFDPVANKWVVYAPKKASGVVTAPNGVSGLSGALGLFRPSVTFTLSGLGAATAQQAQAAIAAVQSFIAKNKQPPQIPLSAVASLQKADGALKSDGLWGPNARAAAAFYTGKPVDQLPAVAKPYAKSKVTWRPPAKAVTGAPIATPAPVAAPAPKMAKAKKPKARPAAVVVAKPPAPPLSTSAYAPLPITGGATAPVPLITDVFTPPVPDVALPPPAPLPAAPNGMKTVGLEPSNPGLPPVDPNIPGPAVATSPSGVPVDAQGRPVKVVLDVSGPKIVQTGKKARKHPRPAFPAPKIPGVKSARSTPWPDEMGGGGVPHWMLALMGIWALDSLQGRRAA